MAMVAVVAITGGAVAVVVAVVAAAVVVVPGKGFKENPEKFSPRREKGILLGLPTREGVRMGVISAPFNALPA